MYGHVYVPSMCFNDIYNGDEGKELCMPTHSLTGCHTVASQDSAYRHGTVMACTPRSSSRQGRAVQQQWALNHQINTHCGLFLGFIVDCCLHPLFACNSSPPGDRVQMVTDLLPLPTDLTLVLLDPDICVDAFAADQLKVAVASISFLVLQ